MSTLKRKAEFDGGSISKKPKATASITSFFSVVPPSEGSAALASATTGGQVEAVTTAFDKAKWVATLTAEQKQLLQLEIDTLHESWLAHLKEELVSEQFLELKRYLKREYQAGVQIFPPQDEIYSWARHTPFNTVKIVIVGQDPYHNVHQAHGLAFSVRPPTPAPPSLRNMYLALQRDYPSFVPPPRNGGLLTPWADRGVLLLNTCLTVRAHQANSHANRGWERFTQKVIDLLAAKRTRGIVFIAWGTPASKRVMKIDTKRHLVLKAVHPSPLSAHKGFFDCGHFRMANEWLVSRYGPGSEVDWSLGGGPPAPAPSGSNLPEIKPSMANSLATTTASATATSGAVTAGTDEHRKAARDHDETRGETDVGSSITTKGSLTKHDPTTTTTPATSTTDVAAVKVSGSPDMPPPAPKPNVQRISPVRRRTSGGIGKGSPLKKVVSISDEDVVAAKDDASVSPTLAKSTNAGDKPVDVPRKKEVGNAAAVSMAPSVAMSFASDATTVVADMGTSSALPPLKTVVEKESHLTDDDDFGEPTEEEEAVMLQLSSQLDREEQRQQPALLSGVEETSDAEETEKDE